MTDIPGFWMNETSGVLRPAVEAYLNNRPMTDAQIAAMREYLRQWIASPNWMGPGIATLRATINGLVDRKAISAWLDLAVEVGADPL